MKMEPLPRLLAVAALVISITALMVPTARCYSDDELWEMPSHQAISLLCARNVTAKRYANALIARIKQYKCINAFAYFDEHKVLKDAIAVDEKYNAGESIEPLCGFAFGVKDNIDVSGYPTGAGTPALEGRRPASSAPLVRTLRQANGVVLGKMRMHELAADVTSINPKYGPVLNPYNNLYHVGGSSGGSGAAVAARMMAAALCTDTGGSCRIPASLNGVVGFRPTTGCYNGGGGIVPMTTTRDTAGVIARSVKDVIIFDKIVSACPRDYKPGMAVAGMRVGYPTNWWEGIGNETQAAFQAARDALEAAGAVLVPMSAQALVDTYYSTLGDLVFYTYEMTRELGRYLLQHKYDISTLKLINKIASPGTKAWLQSQAFDTPLDSYPTPADYAQALCQNRTAIIDLFVALFDENNVDLLVVPTTPITSRPIYDTEPFAEVNGLYSYTYDAFAPTSQIDTTAAIPGLSIPVGLASDGMPIGIEFYARPKDDGLLLTFGALVEGLFAATPPPPASPACKGCMPKVKPIKVDIPQDKYSPYVTEGSGSALPATFSWALDFTGKCPIQKAHNFPLNGPYAVKKA